MSIANWKSLFKGVERGGGRDVELLTHLYGGGFKVLTTQRGTEIAHAPGYSDGAVNDDGAAIEIEAETVDELRANLYECSFSPAAVDEIIRHAQNPGVSK